MNNNLRPIFNWLFFITAGMILLSCAPYSRVDSKMDMGYVGKPMMKNKLTIINDPLVTIYTPCALNSPLQKPLSVYIFSRNGSKFTTISEPVLIIEGQVVSSNRVSENITSMGSYAKYFYYDMNCGELNRALMRIGSITIEGKNYNIPDIRFIKGEQRESGIVWLPSPNTK
jgi:hypothetical protein